MLASYIGQVHKWKIVDKKKANGDSSINRLWFIYWV